MIERRYSCNVCRDVKPYQELHGLYWNSGGWIKRESTDCENHICDACLFSIGGIATEYAAVRPVKTKDT